jgi:cysteinyl-tRNA synthetase
MLLYNSLSRQKEELPPPPGPIRMYFCGPTVYHRIHIGNARPFVLSLWLKRWLEQQRYDVMLVENITDINDKIYDAARELGIGSEELARKATRWYIEDTDDLGLGRPDAEPLASETIREIIDLIDDLIGRGLAYESGGDVYFRVARYPEYGKLSGAQLDDMVAQEPSDLKEDPRDFALWKATKPNEDTWWDSPWGRGRPGWHIECSAMAEALLGPSFEVHGGGLDLRFPHHENELAQSRGAGREFARIWMHNGMLELAAEKMSKSVGNIVSLREALDRWGREPILVYFLSAHWRKPVDFSDELMDQARAQAQAFRDYFVGLEYEREDLERGRLEEVLDDDFNTPDALALLHEWRSSGRSASLAWGLELFGLESLTRPAVAPADVRELAERRARAREVGKFEEADRLREQIERAGWEVRDVPGGFQLVPK